MQKIIDEYNNHQVPEEIKSTIDDPLVLALNIDDIVKKLEQEERQLLRRVRRNKLLQTLPFSRVDVLKAEEACCMRNVKLIDDTINMYIEIMSLIDENNLSEMVKLVDFLVTKYLSNKEYLGGQFKSIEYAARGITFIDNRLTDTSKETKEFINSKLSDMKKQKQLEKKQ